MVIWQTNNRITIMTKKQNKTKPDIKYLNIPNICFSLTDKKDKRELKFIEQRKEQGFDDSETWSLTDTICHFIIPRLKRFKIVNDGSPARISSLNEWHIIIDKIILSLELVSRDNGNRIWTDTEYQQINEGLDLFREYFLDLWW